MLVKIQTTIFYTALLILSIVAWKVYVIVEQRLCASKEELLKAKQEIVKLTDDNNKLTMANTLLKKNQRIAVISDVTYENADSPETLKTTFSFVETDARQHPIEDKKFFTIAGNLLYVDTQVIKFSDDFVEQGDLLKGTALCLFRRLFGEKQKPEDGFALDPEGKIPRVYNLDSPDATEFQTQLWANFWTLASNPAQAQKIGVRAAHGIAPCQMLQPGTSYILEMRSTGEMTFRPEQ